MRVWMLLLVCVVGVSGCSGASPGGPNVEPAAGPEREPPEDSKDEPVELNSEPPEEPGVAPEEESGVAPEADEAPGEEPTTQPTEDMKSELGEGLKEPDGTRKPVRIAKPRPGQGGLDRSAFKKVIWSHRGALRDCYEQELAKQPGLEGEVTVKWTIHPQEGAVANAAVTKTTLNNERVENCILDVARAMAFPAVKHGGIVVVSYPFVFQATAEEDADKAEELTSLEVCKALEHLKTEKESGTTKECVAALEELRQEVGPARWNGWSRCAVNAPSREVVAACLEEHLLTEE